LMCRKFFEFLNEQPIERIDAFEYHKQFLNKIQSNCSQKQHALHYFRIMSLSV
jgi:hypothetical protein